MFSNEKSVDISESTFIIPSISVGNVPQLAVDLLVNNAKPEYIGFIFHEHLIPIIGPNAYDESSSIISSSCEVYFLASKKIVFLQIRGSIVPGREEEFGKDLINWAVENKAKRIVTLSSILADVRKDKDLDGCQIRYLLPSIAGKDLVKVFQSFDWKEYEDPRLPDDKSEGDYDRIYVPGGGFGQIIYTIGNEIGCSTVFLMMFVYEGDNRDEAITMADSLNHWIDIVDVKASWIPPISWSSLYGNPPPLDIY
ncbi:hypothetical protein J437_LFUL013388 [Ladona fulva]|uniref:Proteasome assembly chaperone 2 n=1 Tax=Ladona fulva TaxID=123851 RepID=A0A8K0KJ78_LADFU|nr:hypothetical protein J437_LFUL013388 [Ladona fulva]